MNSRALTAFLTLFFFPFAVLCADDSGRTLIQNRGSDSMAIAVVAWAEAYKKKNPATGVTVSGGGTGTGIASLINGTVDIANASRAMTRKEIHRAKERGIAPVQHIIGYDAVAIYVHKDNPVASISFDQLAGIYGQGGQIESWKALGVEVPGCGDQNMVRVGRQNSSGTYGFLRSDVLDGARFRQGTLEAQSSKDLVSLVGNTPCAIGYSSFAYASPDTRVVCISEEPEASCFVPGIENITEQTYPITRPLYMYTNGPASGDIKNYLDWILSDQGQCILLASRYAPIRDIDCEP